MAQITPEGFAHFIEALSIPLWLGVGNNEGTAVELPAARVRAETIVLPDRVRYQGEVSFSYPANVTCAALFSSSCDGAMLVLGDVPKKRVNAGQTVRFTVDIEASAQEI